MKIAGKTLSEKGGLIDVFECEYCGARSTSYETIRRCEIYDHHAEEYGAGII